jgi:hypothetical protein
MEKIVIQNDGLALNRVEDFIAALCYENHLDNYHATISVPVMQMVQTLLADLKFKQDDTLTISSGLCRKGLFFNITSGYDLLNTCSIDSEPSPTLFSVSFSLAHLLADEVSIHDEGKTIQFLFYLRGIPMVESERRKQVIASFDNKMSLVQV